MAAAAVVLTSAAGHCQLLEFCRLKDVKIEPLPNAVRIRLIADGVMRMEWDPRDFWEQDVKTKQWHRRKRKDFRFLLENVRGIPAALVNVAVHPVSHIEFSVPPGARESLGVICTIHLYEPAVIGEFRTEPVDWARGRITGDEDYGWPIHVDIEPSHDKRQLYIFVNSVRPHEPGWKRTGKITATPQMFVFARDGRFHVSAVNVDIHKLVQRLSSLAHVPVYIDDQVQRRASVELDGMTVQEVLQAIARAYGLSLVHRDGAYFLSSGVPEATAAYWTSTVGHIPLKYISADSALHSLPDILLSYVRPDPESNSLVVVGPSELVEKVRRDVAVLDRPVWHTRLRAWLVECTCSGDDLRNVRLELSGGEANWQIDSDGRLFVDVAGRRPREILANLRALRRRGLVRVRSSPSIAVANGQGAELFAGQRQYYWRLMTNFRGIQEIGVTYAEAGVRLACLTYASREAIRAAFEFRSDAFVRGGKAPTALQRRVATTLRVRSGDMVVAGGLRELSSDRRHGRSGIYGDMPLVGPLFSSRETHETDHELWVLIRLEARRGALPQPGEGGI